jgi:hypothetical protein
MLFIIQVRPKKTKTEQRKSTRRREIVSSMFLVHSYLPTAGLTLRNEWTRPTQLTPLPQHYSPWWFPPVAGTGCPPECAFMVRPPPGNDTAQPKQNSKVKQICCRTPNDARHLIETRRHG